MASLAWSYDGLPRWGRWTLLQLSVFEGGFTARAASAVLDPSGLDHHGALDALELLTSAGLLRYDADVRRFALPQIVQSFARSRHDDLDRERARIRHGRAYATLGERDVLVLLRGPQGVARFSRLLADADNLVAAARRGRQRDDAVVVVGTMRALGVLLLRRGPLTVLLALLDEVASTPSLPPADRDELDVLRARCLRSMGQLSTARSLAEAALQRIRGRPGDAARWRAEAEALLLVGQLHHASVEQSMAEVAARSAIALAQHVGDPLLEAEGTLLVGASLSESGRWDEARGWFEASLAAFQRLGSARDEARVLAELGRGEHVCGRFVGARATYRRALSACREVGDRVREIVVLKDLGLLEKDLRRSRDADALYREALHRSAEIGDRSTEAWLWGALGYLHLEQLDPAEARAPLEQAVAVATELGDPNVCQWEAGLARLCALRQDFEAAQRWLDAATSHERSRTSTLRVWVRSAAAEVAFRAGRRDEAEAELAELDRWLVARKVDPASRMVQEVQRVRLLLGSRRR